MRKLFLLPLVVFAMGLGVTAAHAAESTGTVTIVERSTCTFACEAFFFHGTGAIGDFSLSAVRASRTSGSATFPLVPGVYTVTQSADSGFPLVGVACTSDGRRLVVNSGSTGVNFSLRDGEIITCMFTNEAVTPTPTATATSTPVPATSTPVPTSTPLPTAIPATPVPQVIIIQQPAAVTTSAPVATAPVTTIRPPNTGDAGLSSRKLFSLTRLPAWGDEGTGRCWVSIWTSCNPYGWW